MNQEKSDLRKTFMKIRNSVSLTRKVVSGKKVLKIAKLNFTNILSFSSKKREINLFSLNKKLAEENRLFLPKVFENSLKIYKVTNLEKDLIKGSFNILEPNPEICEEIDIKDISCVLVPALAFDKKNNRLGYGRGYYDRFLKQLDCPFLGIGFLEQLSEKNLPKETHDINLNHVLLF